jgi:RNA polymerase sigma-70 factor, ECF subfamily
MHTSGDRTFESMLREHGAAVRLHCYRLLGSSHDGDDMVQETFARAFRARDSLTDAAAARPWLYRIATNVCLDELKRRPRRARGPELGPAITPDGPADAELPAASWIEPMPGAWLQGAERDPGALYSLRESVALAFVAALQVLTPAQRAVLLLRDVVGLSADETANTLSCSLAAANSTLHRARVALEERVGPRGDWSPDVEGEPDRELLARYLCAWESGEPELIVSLLREDATMSMPPFLAWLKGREDIRGFFHARRDDCLHKTAVRALAVRANDGWGLALYRKEGARFQLFGLHVVEQRAGLVRTIDQFMGEPALRAFALPSSP